MRWLAAGIGLLVLLLGLACLNYTNGFGIDHHAQWAAEHGLPAPSYGIFVMGAALAVLGAGTVGFTIARGWRNRGSRGISAADAH